MYFADLGPCDYFGSVLPVVPLAVGWLEQGHAFPSGPAQRDHRVALGRLVKDAWQPVMAMGWHVCGLCSAPPRGPISVRIDDGDVTLGISNVMIPGDGGIYLAPSLILHYIDVHDYVPPPVFQDAVLRCPTMKSPSYFEALRRHGMTIAR